MLQKSAAIVLATVKYGDSSVIVKTYTREQGLKSFIAGGLQNKKGPLKPALVQPLSQLHLLYYDRGKGELRRIKEARVDRPYKTLFFDPIKSAVTMFLSEFLVHVLKEEETNTVLYDFLSESLMSFDEQSDGQANFHLYFLMNLTAYLGFMPEKPKGDSTFFDLLNGVYVGYEPPHAHVLRQHHSTLWKSLQIASVNEIKDLRLNRDSREELLNALLEYYRLHLNDFGKLRSLDVLKALFA